MGHGNLGTQVGLNSSWVTATWGPRWEPEKDHKTAAETQLIANMRERQKSSEKNPWTTRRDAHLTDQLLIQGNWVPEKERCTRPLLESPQLRELIQISPGMPVNPDRDIAPTANFEVYQGDRGLAAVYRPGGKFISDINAERCNTLMACYQSTAGKLAAEVIAHN